MLTSNLMSRLIPFLISRKLVQNTPMSYLRYLEPHLTYFLVRGPLDLLCCCILDIPHKPNNFSIQIFLSEFLQNGFYGVYYWVPVYSKIICIIPISVRFSPLEGQHCISHKLWLSHLHVCWGLVDIFIAHH